MAQVTARLPWFRITVMHHHRPLHRQFHALNPRTIVITIETEQLKLFASETTRLTNLMHLFHAFCFYCISFSLLVSYPIT